MKLPVVIASYALALGAFAATEHIMRGIFDSMAEVLPLSLDARAFATTANRRQVKGALEELAAHARSLEIHAERKVHGLQFLASSLQRDAATAHDLYARGKYEPARFMLRNLTHTCVSCHSSFPSGADFPASGEFFRSIDAAELPPHQLADLYLVTRQFEAAARTYESMLLSSTTPLTMRLYYGSFVSYLKVALRVKADPRRVAEVLGRLGARVDVPGEMQERMDDWLADLVFIEDNQLLATSSLDNALRLIKRASTAMTFPRDRAGLMLYVAASANLKAIVHAYAGPPSEQLAQIYYQLGVTETLIGESYWVSELEHYLESAIRTAPNGPFARPAYELLEQTLLEAYSGSSGEHVPEASRQLLRSLKSVIGPTAGG